MGIGAGKIAFDHRLDVELADLMAVAVAMDAHHADAALPVSVLDQRHVRASSSDGAFSGTMVARSGPIMSNVRAIGQASGASFWHRPCIGSGERQGGRSMTTTTEIHPVDQMLPTPRLLALGLQHVLVMYAGAVAVPLIIGRALKLPPEDVAFLISAGPVRLWARDAGAMHRLSRRRYPPACHDGGDLCLGRPDAVDGRRARYRPARHLRLGDRCRNLRHHCRALHQPAATAVSSRRHRNHHPGDRHLA